MTPTTDLETALLDAHYQGDPVARFAWLGWCEDNGVKLTEVGITGVWRGTLAEWLEVGPGLVQRVALERVELVDREPEFLLPTTRTGTTCSIGTVGLLTAYSPADTHYRWNGIAVPTTGTHTPPARTPSTTHPAGRSGGRGGGDKGRR